MIADEPVSALDVSVQAHVLNLLADLRESMGLAIVFISHDLGVVGQISDRVAVMYMGRMIETAVTRDILDRPIHPYTRHLMAAMPQARSDHPAQGRNRGERAAEPVREDDRMLLSCAMPSGELHLRDGGTARSAPSRPGRSVACHNV